MDNTAQPAPEPTGNAARPVSMSDAFNTALATLEQGNGDSQQAEEVVSQTAAPEQTGNVEQPVVEDPEHIKWVKSYNGLAENNEINVDRLAKQAFELNKQNQTTTQKINQLEALLQHPAIKQAVAQVIAPEAKQPKPEQPQGEKTDEQILEEWVMERVNKALKPVQQESQVLFQKYAESEAQNAYTKLKEEFGTDEGGKPLYDSVRDEVGKQIAAAAQQAGVPYVDFCNELIRRGMLYPTLSSTARTLLYPKLKEQIAKAQANTIQQKKKLGLPSKGTAAQAVRPVEKRPTSILDAAKQAEEQNPEFASLA